MAITRDQIVQLILVEHLTEEQAAERLGVHRNTIVRAKRKYDIDVTEWWKYQKIYCSDCNTEIDPSVKLKKGPRKRLIGKENPLCDECKEQRRKEYMREKTRSWRERNRERYNQYMREWRKKNKDRWDEIKSRSRKKSNDDDA